jgi:hypothetical protein
MINFLLGRHRMHRHFQTILIAFQVWAHHVHNRGRDGLKVQPFAQQQQQQQELHLKTLHLVDAIQILAMVHVHKIGEVPPSAVQEEEVEEQEAVLRSIVVETLRLWAQEDEVSTVVVVEEEEKGDEVLVTLTVVYLVIPVEVDQCLRVTCKDHL